MLGIFDSGLGGLSVWNAIKEISPQSGILYFGDSARNPYGNLTKEKLFIYSKEGLDLLIELGATHLAIACHTVSTTILPLLRHSSNTPILDIASHSLTLLEPFEKIAIIGTKATIASGYYQRALGEKIVSVTACPDLVPMIESGMICQNTIKNSLKSVDSNADVLFLACTHFPLIKNEIGSILPNITLLDPAASFAKTLIPLTINEFDKFYTSGDPTKFHKFATFFTQGKEVAFPFLIKSLYLPLIS
jgi:glutamate racemase